MSPGKDCMHLHSPVMDSLAKSLEIVCAAEVWVKRLYIGNPEAIIDKHISL